MSRMDKSRGPRTTTITLLVSGVLIALVMLPTIFTIGLSIPDICGINSGENNTSDPAESEDDLNSGPIVDRAISGLIFSKIIQAQLERQTTRLSPVYPPPEDS